MNSLIPDSKYQELKKKKSNDLSVIQAGMKGYRERLLKINRLGEKKFIMRAARKAFLICIVIVPAIISLAVVGLFHVATPDENLAFMELFRFLELFSKTLNSFNFKS